MQLAHRWADRNLTRLELIVSVSILLLLLGFVMRSMMIFFARTEETMLKTSILNINTALKYYCAIATMHGDKNFVSRLLVTSPFSVVQGEQDLQVLPGNGPEDELTARIATYTALPSNYLGELDDPDPDTIAAGSWYFDNADKTLNYIVRNGEFFQGDLEGVPIIKLKIIIDYNDRDGDGRFNPDIDKFESVHLQSVGQYSWAK